MTIAPEETAEPKPATVTLALTLHEYELLMAFVALGMVAHDLFVADDPAVVGPLQQQAVATAKLVALLRARVGGEAEAPIIARIDASALEAFGAELKLRLVKSEPKSPIVAPSTAEVIEIAGRRNGRRVH